MRRERTGRLPNFSAIDRQLTQRDGRVAYVALSDIDRVLEHEDDLSYLIAQRQDYMHTQRMRSAERGIYIVLSGVGFSEDQGKQAFLFNADGNTISGIDPASVVYTFCSSLDRNTQIRLKAPLVAYGSANREINKFFIDEEDVVLGELAYNGEISLLDYFRESIRIRQAHIDLMTMQIDWLKAKEAKERKEKRKLHEQSPKKKGVKQVAKVAIPATEEIGVIETTAEVVAVEPAVEQPFNLRDWTLYAAPRYWSRDIDGCVPVPTSTRDEAVAVYSKLTNGTLTIKPKSVIGAIDFCVTNHAMVVQSLATRFRVSRRPELRDWVRIPRGQDWIGIYFPDPNEKVAVFFSGPRDKVKQAIGL